MSKESDLRAMREARWTARNSGSPAKAAPRPTLARPPVAPPAAAGSAGSAGSGATSADEALCGHKSMNGRTCTREAGHSAKSHRYS